MTWMRAAELRNGHILCTYHTCMIHTYHTDTYINEENRKKFKLSLRILFAVLGH